MSRVKLPSTASIACMRLDDRSLAAEVGFDFKAQTKSMIFGSSREAEHLTEKMKSGLIKTVQMFAYQKELINSQTARPLIDMALIIDHSGPREAKASYGNYMVGYSHGFPVQHSSNGRLVRDVAKSLYPLAAESANPVWLLLMKLSELRFASEKIARNVVDDLKKYQELDCANWIYQWD